MVVKQIGPNAYQVTNTLLSVIDINKESESIWTNLLASFKIFIFL